MTNNNPQTSTQPETNLISLFSFGGERSEALLSVQKELLEAYEQSMRAWIARAQAEASLWSGLPAKLAGSENVLKALEAYGDCVSQQMQMSVEDGQRLFNDCQQLVGKVAGSLGAWTTTGKA